MSSESVSLDEWLDATEGGLTDVVPTALSMDSVEILDRGQRIPAGMSGAYIPLVGDDTSVQIGLVSSEKGCQTLARALLCMTDESEPIAPADVADAVGEIINMMAGAIKRRVNDRIPSMALGLPIFINGAIEPTEKLQSQVAFVRIGDVEAALLVLTHKR